MSKKKDKKEEEAIVIAMGEIRARGLSDEQMNSLFDGDSSISAREAFLIAQIQHLEAKVFALSSIMEEIATMKKMDASIVAQAALEKIAIPRKISEKMNS